MAFRKASPPDGSQGEKFQQAASGFKSRFHIAGRCHTRRKGEPGRLCGFHDTAIEPGRNPKGRPRRFNLLHLRGCQNRSNPGKHLWNMSPDFFQCPKCRVSAQSELHDINPAIQQSLRQRNGILHPVNNQHGNNPRTLDACGQLRGESGTHFTGISMENRAWVNAVREFFFISEYVVQYKYVARV
jgi:rubredoxin